MIEFDHYDYYGNYYDNDGIEIPRWKIERENLFRNAGHIPNKNEAKKLRQLMAETGLKEEELRKYKKYRKILSDAQKPEVKKKSNPILKSITQELKLAKEHPKVLFIYNLMRKGRKSFCKEGHYKTVKDALESKEYSDYKLLRRIDSVFNKKKL